MKKLRVLADKYAVIGEIRGKGLMIGMELVTDAASKTPAKELCDAIITRAYHNGLILLSCGQSTVRFMPPLMIRESDVDEAVDLLDHSMAEELSSPHPHVARGVATA
jgi:4-aminobutyrate aminotransferase